MSSQYEYLQDKRSTMTKDKAEEKRDRLSQERGFATNVEDRHVREGYLTFAGNTTNKKVPRGVSRSPARGKPFGDPRGLGVCPEWGTLGYPFPRASCTALSTEQDPDGACVTMVESQSERSRLSLQGELSVSVQLQELRPSNKTNLVNLAQSPSIWAEGPSPWPALNPPSPS